MEPQGRHLTARQVLRMVETGEDPDRGVLYRRQDGRIYGLKHDRPLWRECGYRYMGSIPFVRQRVKAARKLDVREESIAWYLLTDVERQEAATVSL